MLELLGGAVLRELWGDRERDVSELSARAVVAGGQPELQCVSCKLAGGCGERVADELRLRRGVHWACREHVCVVWGRHVQGGDGVGSVHRVPGAHVDVRLGCEFVVLLVRDGVRQGIGGVHADGAPRR